MNASDRALYDRIVGFELDEAGSSFCFSKRLARENNWSHGFAQRVIDEYKRFVFLAMRAGHPVTPSDEVDQAWHLHLTYTRSYWDGLCRGVLGRPLHHDPTKGGSDEDAKYHDWYERTLASYRRMFGEEPPADVWPSVSKRFGRDVDFVRVNRNRAMGRRGLMGPVGVGFGICLGVVLLAGCDEFWGLEDAETGTRILFYLALVIGVLLIIKILKKLGGGGRGGRGGCGGCGGIGCGGDGCGGGGCGGCGGCGSV